MDNCPFHHTYVETFYLFVCGIGPICLLGLLLNCLNLIVLSKKTHFASHSLLRVLAVSDIVFLLTCAVHFVFRHLYAYAILGDQVFRRGDREIIPLLYWYSIAPYQMALQNRNWTIVLISLERLISIRWPMWASKTSYYQMFDC